MKKIVLIANSDDIKNINDVIDEGDLIVRFNVPSSENINRTGEEQTSYF